jgi:uncharacterized membrane protein YqjE
MSIFPPTFQTPSFPTVEKFCVDYPNSVLLLGAAFVFVSILVLILSAVLENKTWKTVSRKATMISTAVFILLSHVSFALWITAPSPPK